MIRGEEGFRVDERFRWWYSDDDIEMQTRHRNGSAIIPYTGLVPGSDTGLTGVLYSWAEEDRQKFVAKWKCEPW